MLLWCSNTRVILKGRLCVYDAGAIFARAQYSAVWPDIDLIFLLLLLLLLLLKKRRV